MKVGDCHAGLLVKEPIRVRRRRRSRCRTIWWKYRRNSGGLTVSSKTLGVFASLVLLIVRGIFLWVVVPLGCIAWVIVSPWLHKRGVAIGQFLGWIDINLIALIQRSLLRPFIRDAAQPWVPAKKIYEVVHRIGRLDLF